MLSIYSLLILLFAPVWFCNNLLLCRVATIAGLIIVMTHKKQEKLCLPQVMFLIWLAWAVLCCVLSDFPRLAIEGFYLRVEGLLSWATLTAAAYLTDKTSKTNYALMAFLCAISLILLVLKAIFYSDIRFQAYVIENVALSSFAACAFVFLWTYGSPYMSAFAIGLLVIATTRSGLFAAMAGILCYYLMKGTLKTAYKKIVALLGILTILILFTPIKQKIENLNYTFTGSRSQWLKQSEVMTKALPLTGYGLDTLSHYLKPAKGETRQRLAIAERVHFLPLDICLQTGWIGLTLFMLFVGSAIAFATKNPSGINLAAASVLVTWFIFGCINPQGLHSLLLTLVCVFQMKKLKLNEDPN